MDDGKLIKLDEISDRLGDLYQRVGRMVPDETDREADWTGLLDEIVEITAAVEEVSNRKARLYG